MNYVPRFFLLLATVGLAQCAIIISNLHPEDLSIAMAPDGTVTLSAVVSETQTSIKSVELDFRANNKKALKSTTFMSQVSGTDRYEYVAKSLKENVNYCFRVKGKSNVQKWSEFSCFKIRKLLNISFRSSSYTG